MPCPPIPLSGWKETCYGALDERTRLSRIKKQISALLVGFGLFHATAQTFTVLHTLTGPEGSSPWGGLILSSNAFYGSATGGGYGGGGTLFKLNTDGSGFTNLYSLSYNSDGSGCYSPLLLVSNTLYGTAQDGGSSNKGTIFAIKIDGSGFTNLYNFSGGSNGANPRAALVVSGTTLYGAASAGGDFGAGTLFRINADGTGFTNIYSFGGGADLYGLSGPIMYRGLVTSGNMLYGTTSRGGAWSNGMVFKINVDGAGFTNLHSFAAGGLSLSDPNIVLTNSDGISTFGGLVLSGGMLYGTATEGGSSASGTVFKINPDGTHFTILHHFSMPIYDDALETSTNWDGANPVGALIPWGDTLYGTTVNGGGSGVGVVFAINTDGGGFTNLYSFAAGARKPSSNIFTNSDGGHPRAGLIVSGNTLYGTAVDGGDPGHGTVFSFALPLPQLTIVPFGESVILSWPAVAAGFTLQTAPAVTGQFTNLVGATSPYTNPVSSGQKFFRLISN